MQQNKYHPIVNESEIEIGEGSTVVVTGWSDPKTIKLKESSYAVKGALRSCHVGIDNLVRNLLANPFVKGVVLYDNNPFNEAPDGNPLRAILNLIKFGVDSKLNHNGRIQIKGGVGTISGEFSLEAIASLQELTVIKETRHDAIAGACLFINQQEKETRPQYIFPPPEIKPNAIPPTIGAVVKGSNVADCWLQILNLIRKGGKIRPTSDKNGYWQEVLDLTTVVGTEEDVYPDYLPASPASLEKYLPQLQATFPPNDVRYTYGSRLRSWFGVDQLQQVAEKLANDLDSASGVCNLWDTSDHQKGGSPCLNHLWFRIIDNRLTLTSIFRSNDMFNAWILNALGLRELQKEVLNNITTLLHNSSRTTILDQTIMLGELVTISESAHLYSHSWGYADAVLSKNNLSGKDPAGNLLIGKDGDQFTVKLMDSLETICATVSASTVESLKRKCLEELPQLTTQHSLYLGYELARLKLEKEYRQR